MPSEVADLVERIAAVDVGGGVALVEPLLALRRRTVGPRFLVDTPLRLLLDAIVTDGSRGG